MVEPPTIHPLFEYAVPYKMKAADYHLKFMRRILSRGLLTRQGMERLEGRERQLAFQRNDEFDWHFEAFLFQLYSSFDLILQELNIIRGLNIPMEDITWRRISKEIADDPVIVHLQSVRNEDWFRKLRYARHQAMHHHPPILAAIARDHKIEALAFGWPVRGGKGIGGPELFSECQDWWRHAREAHTNALCLMRGTEAAP